jgi:hypothetical protein
MISPKDAGAQRDSGKRFQIPASFQRSLQVFAVFLAVYLVTWGGHYTTGDGSKKVAWAKELLAGKLVVAANGGAPTSKYGIGHSLIAMPALAASSFIRQHTGIRSEPALYTLIFVVNGALFLGLVSYYLFHLYPVRRVWITISLLGFASTWWPYTKQDFSEVLVTTALFAGFLLIRSGFPLAGMFVAAFTLTIRVDSAVPLGLLGLWALYREQQLRTALKLCVATVPAILLVAAANYVRYHSIFDHGYDGEGFTESIFVGLQGILFSAGKSVFLFSPPLILGFWGWRRFFRRPTVRLDAVLFLAIFVAELLLYSKWWDWSSDDAWGVRFMIPAVMLMCIPLIEVLERRFLVGVVAVAGVWVQSIAVLVGGLDYVYLLRTAHLEREALFVSGRDRVDIEDMRFNPTYSEIAGNWILVRHLLHIPPKSSRTKSFETTGTPLFDTLPPGAWAEAARWDFIWLRRGRHQESKLDLETDVTGSSRKPATRNPPASEVRMK